MAVITSPLPVAVIAPKAFAAKFSGKTAEQIASVVLAPSALPDDAPIKARDIRISADDGVALASATYSAATFAKAVAHRLALFSGGQTLDRIQEGMPQLAQVAIVAGAAGLKFGAGADVRTLKLALAVALQHVMSLPTRAPKTKTAPVVVSSPTAALAAAHALPDALIVERADARDTRAAIGHVMAEDERSDALQALTDVPAAIAARAEEAARVASMEAAASAARAAEAESARKADAMAQVMASLTKAGESARIRAHAFATLANELGIKLTPAQLKILDALEGIAQAA